MTVHEALDQGICRLRRSMWASPMAYMKIDIIQHTAARFLGPWFHLYDRTCQEAIGEKTPQDFLALGQHRHADDYEAYTGPLDKDDVP